MKIFLHQRNQDEEYNHKNNEVDGFARIPTVEEYIALDDSTDWYKVEIVIHTPFVSEVKAEVYAVKVNREEVIPLK